MSAVTKYLNQKTTLQLGRRAPDGSIMLDEYGEPLYEDRVRSIRCRKEISTEDVLTSTGAVQKSTTTFYVDNTVSVALGDKMEGKVILMIEDFIDFTGHSIGYKIQV